MGQTECAGLQQVVLFYELETTESPFEEGPALILGDERRGEEPGRASHHVYPETPSIQGVAANYSEGPVISWTSEPAPPETRATMVARLRRFHWASI